MWGLSGWNKSLFLTFHPPLPSYLSAAADRPLEYDFRLLHLFLYLFSSVLRCCKHKSQRAKPRAHINVRIDSGAHKPLIWSLVIWEHSVNKSSPSKSSFAAFCQRSRDKRHPSAHASPAPCFSSGCWLAVPSPNLVKEKKSKIAERFAA